MANGGGGGKEMKTFCYFFFFLLKVLFSVREQSLVSLQRKGKSQPKCAEVTSAGWACKPNSITSGPVWGHKDTLGGAHTAQAVWHHWEWWGPATPCLAGMLGPGSLSLRAQQAVGTPDAPHWEGTQASGPCPFPLQWSGCWGHPGHRGWPSSHWGQAVGKLGPCPASAPGSCSGLSRSLTVPWRPLHSLFSTKRIALYGSREMGCGVHTKQPAERSGTCCERGVKSIWHHGNQRVLSVEKNSKYRGEWQGRNVFSRKFCPGDAMAKPQSSALQTLGDTFSTRAAAAAGFPGNVAGWNRAWGKVS